MLNNGYVTFVSAPFYDQYQMGGLDEAKLGNMLVRLLPLDTCYRVQNHVHTYHMHCSCCEWLHFNLLRGEQYSKMNLSMFCA